jgi:hypothetical protein
MMMLVCVVLVLAMVQLAAAWRVTGVAGRISSRGFAPLKMSDDPASAGPPDARARAAAKGGKKEEEEVGPPLSEKDQIAVEKLQAKMEADPTFDPMKGKTLCCLLSAD